MNTSFELVPIKPKLIIIRGLPGSGKSTCAKNLLAKGYGRFKWFEADMYYDQFEKYCWTPERHRLAHQWCQSQTEISLFAGYTVIVSNTFCSHEDLSLYAGIAESFGAAWTVIECTGEFHNIHGVSDDIVSKMRDSWADFEVNPNWKYYVDYDI